MVILIGSYPIESGSIPLPAIIMTKKFFKQCLKCINQKKFQSEKETLKHVLSNMRTDAYDDIPAKQLVEICRNYRIEAIDLLDAVSFLFRIADELERKAEEALIREMGQGKKTQGGK